MTIINGYILVNNHLFMVEFHGSQPMIELEVMVAMR
jgi:hypothetical protein